MPATETDLLIEQGVTWAHGWAVTATGITFDETWAARAQVRSHPATETVLHTFAASIDTAGKVVIAVDAAESTAWQWSQGFYDVEVFDQSMPPVVLRVAKGHVTVDPEVTR